MYCISPDVAVAGPDVATGIGTAACEAPVVVRQWGVGLAVCPGRGSSLCGNHFTLRQAGFLQPGECMSSRHSVQRFAVSAFAPMSSPLTL